MASEEREYAVTQTVRVQVLAESAEHALYLAALGTRQWREWDLVAGAERRVEVEQEPA